MKAIVLGSIPEIISEGPHLKNAAEVTNISYLVNGEPSQVFIFDMEGDAQKVSGPMTREIEELADAGDVQDLHVQTIPGEKVSGWLLGLVVGYTAMVDGASHEKATELGSRIGTLVNQGGVAGALGEMVGLKLLESLSNRIEARQENEEAQGEAAPAQVDLPAEAPVEVPKTGFESNVPFGELPEALQKIVREAQAAGMDVKVVKTD